MKYSLIFKDEKDFITQETNFLNKILPFFKKYFVIKLIIIVILLMILYKFQKFFVIIISIILIQYIKFKRTRLGINLELEPSYLLGLAITLVYGIEYGLIFITLPFLISFNGFGIGLLVNYLNKLIFIISIFFYWSLTKNTSLLIYFSIFIVILTDIFGFFIRKKFGQTLFEIFSVVFTNSLIRWIYFSLFLKGVIIIII